MSTTILFGLLMMAAVFVGSAAVSYIMGMLGMHFVMHNSKLSGITLIGVAISQTAIACGGCIWMLLSMIR